MTAGETKVVVLPLLLPMLKANDLDVPNLANRILLLLDPFPKSNKRSPPPAFDVNMACTMAVKPLVAILNVCGGSVRLLLPGRLKMILLVVFESNVGLLLVK